jgi:hypothetical protein
MSSVGYHEPVFTPAERVGRAYFDATGAVSVLIPAFSFR